MRVAMPLQSIGISEGIANIIKMNSISQLMLPPQNWLAAMKPAIPNLAGLSSLSSLTAFGDQLASMRTLNAQMSISRQLNSQIADWQQIQQRLTTNFTGMSGFQQVALSPWVLQAQHLQQLFANLKTQLDELDPEELAEEESDEPVSTWETDFSSLTQQLATFADSTTAVTTATEVAAMRSEIRTLTILAQRQLDYMEQDKAAEKSPLQVALRIFNIIGIIWTLISIVAFISDRLPKTVAASAPVIAQELATAPADRDRPATTQELQSLKVEVNDALFAVASRTNQVRITTARTQLRATPRLNAAHLGRVIPGTVVVVQQVHRKWALVIAQRPGLNPQQGWLLKKHLSKPSRLAGFFN